MQMLATFTTYMKADFQECVEPNADGEPCGCFRGENTMGNDERGVRPNADLSMVCAFLVKYGQGQVTLPDGVTWDDLATMARKSLVFAYSTHKANRLKVCAGGRYWGSVSEADHVWESSLWAMSVAYSAFFQWDSLSAQQRGYIYQLLKAECNYELERTIPTAYRGDTKAEENGWEANVLAATLGLFPDDELAPRWFQRLREFAINSYSHPDDANDQTVVDPDYDRQTVADLYRGQNLYDDLTLQNHNYFHTSYQNVVIQELGEAALALMLFQSPSPAPAIASSPAIASTPGVSTPGTVSRRWHTRALMHNCQRVMSDVLYWLALSDGELAMPNGNDWSLFLYDQITSYTTAACFLRDPHALMLEELACRQIKARQQTTAEALRADGKTGEIGSWLLRPDVGARRMGVQAHRVMMSWLMHHVLTTADLIPTKWENFRREYAQAKVFSSQNIVRAATASRFTCFSWSEGLKSYTGYIAPFPAEEDSSLLSPLSSLLSHNNLLVPFRQHNTGNFLGWYDVEGRRTNAVPVVAGDYQLDGEGYVMNGELQTNDGALNHRFAIFSTPGNAVVYIDNVRAKDTCTITAERGGLMAVSVDESTSTTRTLYSTAGDTLFTAERLITLPGPWVNIDNAFGIVTIPYCPQQGTTSRPLNAPSRPLNAPSRPQNAPTPGVSTPGSSATPAFGDLANNNSVLTAKLYPFYSNRRRTVNAGDLVDSRTVVYYSNVTAAETARLSAAVRPLSTPDGWRGVIVADPDGTRYLLLSHFADDTPTATVTIDGNPKTFTLGEGHSVMLTLCVNN